MRESTNDRSGARYAQDATSRTPCVSNPELRDKCLTGAETDAIRNRRDAVLASIPAAPNRTAPARTSSNRRDAAYERDRKRGLTANGQPRASRAAQFMPFAALSGYYELARQQERVTEPEHEPTDEEAATLSCTAASLRRGERVRVMYYDRDAYRTVTGILTRIDLALRTLQVVRTSIEFKHIRSIERAPLQEKQLP